MAKNIFNAWKIISNVVKETPLSICERLSSKYNCKVYLKREDLQITRSFKIRGSFYKINNLDDGEKQKGIVCASAGNHAQGVAYSCHALNIRCNIFLPEKTSLQKINRINFFGKDNIKIHLYGKTFDDCLHKSLEYQNDNNSTFIHPFDDKDIITGQGTIGVEIVNQIKPDIIISPIGGGGLISGISNYISETIPDCLLYGTEPSSAASMTQALKQNGPIKLDTISNFIEGASVSKVGELPFNMVKNNLAKIYSIGEGEICHELLNLYQEDGIITEPAGALSVCGLSKIDSNIIKDKNVVCIISGGNNDITRYPEIIEKNLIYLGLRHYFIIKFKQKPGELKYLVNDILGKDDDIIRFEYIKKTDKDYGNVLMGVQISNKENIHILLEKLNNSDFNFKKISESDLIYSYLV